MYMYNVRILLIHYSCFTQIQGWDETPFVIRFILFRKKLSTVAKRSFKYLALPYVKYSSKFILGCWIALWHTEVLPNVKFMGLMVVVNCQLRLETFKCSLVPLPMPISNSVYIFLLSLDLCIFLNLLFIFENL